MLSERTGDKKNVAESKRSRNAVNLIKFGYKASNKRKTPQPLE